MNGNDSDLHLAEDLCCRSFSPLSPDFLSFLALIKALKCQNKRIKWQWHWIHGYKKYPIVFYSTVWIYSCTPLLPWATMCDLWEPEAMYYEWRLFFKPKKACINTRVYVISSDNESFVRLHGPILPESTCGTTFLLDLSGTEIWMIVMQDAHSWWRILLITDTDMWLQYAIVISVTYLSLSTGLCRLITWNTLTWEDGKGVSV